jgi:hypothetical protein
MKNCVSVTHKHTKVYEIRRTVWVVYMRIRTIAVLLSVYPGVSKKQIQCHHVRWYLRFREDSGGDQDETTPEIKREHTGESKPRPK